jgi:hypothetical protein
MIEQRYVAFLCGAFRFATMDALFRAADQAARADRSHRAAPIQGELPTGLVEFLGDLVVEGGEFRFTAIEPDGPEGED